MTSLQTYGDLNQNTQQQPTTADPANQTINEGEFQRGGKKRLSKKEKKELKKKEKEEKLKGKENTSPDGVAEKLYKELPETSFSRTISNPEAVMRRRRQLKLERKLAQFKSKDGGPDSGQ